MMRRFLPTVPSKHSIYLLIFLNCLAGLQSRAAFAREEWFRGLDLEPGVSEASLVLVARVAEVTETKLTLGGKVEESLQQFKFEPLQVLKGVFSRDVLLLNSNDLGGYQFGNVTKQIKTGQMRMLILGRSREGYTIAHTVSSLEQSLPPLRDGNDPLIGAAKVLLSVEENRDRARKVTLLLDGLQSTNGAACVPLLAALQRRSLLAAQTPSTAAAIVPHLSDSSPSVREMAAKAIYSLLEADYLNQTSFHKQVVEGLASALERMDADVAARVATIDALGVAGTQAASSGLVRAHLRLTTPSSTLAERAARWRAAGGLRLDTQRDALSSQLDELPLDAPPEIQQAAEWGFGQLDAEECAKRLALRMEKKVAAGLQKYPEIHTLGELPALIAVPRLVNAFKLPLDWTEQVSFALSCFKVPDPRLVPALAELLDPHEPQLRWHAVEALKKIDTGGAAQALQPHLVEEADLLRKLEIAEFIGRHGFRDGYPFAIEHMSEPVLRERAVSALAAIREPRAVEELHRIVQTSHDPAWNSAAVLALGRLGERELAPQLLETVQDLKNPMAPAALVALGDLKETKAMDKVREGLGSRNPEVVAASARAAGSLLTLPEVRGEDVRGKVAALLADGDAALEARTQAFRALLALDDSRLDGALSTAVRDGHLEGGELLAQIEKQIRDRKVKLAP
jgi:HEAT repeat protein